MATAITIINVITFGVAVGLGIGVAVTITVFVGFYFFDKFFKNYE